MKKQRKKYSRPKRPWDKERIEKEKRLLRNYGLRRKREIWGAEAVLREFRRRARNLAARKNEEEEKLLLGKLNKLGLLSKDSTLDDILGLTVDNIFERRLQSLVFRKGMANTLKQSRQFIVHGHIAVNGRRTRWPSQLIKSDKEGKIGFYGKSNVKGYLGEKSKKSAPVEKIERKGFSRKRFGGRSKMKG